MDWLTEATLDGFPGEAQLTACRLVAAKIQGGGDAKHIGTQCRGGFWHFADSCWDVSALSCVVK